MSIDSGELLEVLRRVTSAPGLTYADKPEPLSGGFWAELATFRLADAPEGWRGPLVARVMPDAATAAKESAFQAEVAAQGFPTPPVHAAGGVADGIDGRAFMVMDLAQGRPLLAGLDGMSAIARLPSIARRMPVTLAEVLAALHGLDPVAVGHRLDDAGVTRPNLDAMLEHLLVTSSRLGRDDLVGAASWLQQHRPRVEPIVVCHGDMHPFNVLVDDAGTTTVLDWSGATFASATYDLGLTSLLLSEPPLFVPGLLRPVVRAAGRALSRRFVRVYEKRTGARVDQSSLEWHQNLVCLRALVEVAGWVAGNALEDRRGHPWLIAGRSFADRLHKLTGVAVSPR